MSDAQPPLAALQEPAMLDVHPPHSAIHGWRDFLIHLATITIGLFIALSLESGVEALHHRHIVREARENIRHEIEQNEALAKEDIRSIDGDAARMKENMQKMRELRANPHALEHSSLQFTLEWSSFNQSAWLSARDSGALSFMPTAEVQTYADSYGQQEIINQQAVAIFTRQSDLAAPFFAETDPANIRPAEVQTMLSDTAIIYIRLTTLKQMIQELEKNYTDTLRR